MTLLFKEDRLGEVVRMEEGRLEYTSQMNSVFSLKFEN